MIDVLAVDLGKSRCRLGLLHDGTWRLAEGAGMGGLASPGALAGAEAAIRSVGQPIFADHPIGRIGVAIAGALAAPALAASLATQLQGSFGAIQVVVTSDVVAAHAGAFPDGEGTVLTVGTGVALLRVGADGETKLVDGLGPWLGDSGGGAWIGRQGLRAALMWWQGAGGSKVLAAAAEALFGPVAGIPALVGSADNPAATLGRFTPAVVTCAQAGDCVAADIIRRAGAGLAATVRAARPVRRLAVTGGLAGIVTPALQLVLQGDGDLCSPQGSAIDGMARLASDATTSLERFVTRSAVRTARSAAGMADAAALATEQAQPGLEDLDCRSPAQVAGLVLDTEARAQAALHRARPQIAVAAEAVAQRLLAGGRVFYLGAGTSGRLATLDAAELAPTYSLPMGRVIALLAGGDGAMLRSVEGAEDDGQAAATLLDEHSLSAGDVVIGIAASGRTPFVVSGLRWARARGCLTIAVVNNPGSECAAVADLAVEVLTGPEIVAGSTRMSAGTSQKIVLNAISTAAMVALGKTYGPHMVDLSATNEKLRRRAVRIVQQITHCPRDKAEAALGASGGAVKPAIVSLMTALGPHEAEQRLMKVGGRLRSALPGPA